jgi:hypothetical protein
MVLTKAAVANIRKVWKNKWKNSIQAAKITVRAGRVTVCGEIGGKSPLRG